MSGTRIRAAADVPLVDHVAQHVPRIVPVREVLGRAGTRWQDLSGSVCTARLPNGRVRCRPCVFRIEVELVLGSGRVTLTGVTSKPASDALYTARDHACNRLSELGIPTAQTGKDLHVQVLNPMEADDPVGISLGMFAAIVSVLRGRPVDDGAVIIGDMTV